jgi:cytochrome c-type biogenesis protein
MDVSGVGILAAFAAGVVSFLSPCVLPLVPAYISYIAGESLTELQGQAGRAARSAAIGLALLFVAGFSTVFILFGASATAAGDLLLSWRYELNIVAGIVVIAFGLIMMGALRLTPLQRDLRFHLNLPGGRPVGAYVLGAAFAFGWTPCIGPVLASILAVAAVNSTVGGGILLLAVYSVGLGIPFVAAAAFTGAFLRYSRGLGRVGRRIQIVAGAVLVLMGIAMLTGYLSDMAFWLLSTFPFLQNLG